MTDAFVDEVFASIQGEGPYVGQRHIFVRFIGCDLQCGYCDTPEAVKMTEPESRSCRAQVSPETFEREDVANPLTPSLLTYCCTRLDVPGPSRPLISLTGGEPLLQRDFLKRWLPEIRRSHRIYLETNGVRYEEMHDLAHLIDVVSMDVKLPSATGEASRWDDHRRFLAAATGRELFVKAVVTRETESDDLLQAARMVGEQNASIPFIIQPAGGVQAPGVESMVQLQNKALSILQDVRVVPQVHKVLLVP